MAKMLDEIYDKIVARFPDAVNVQIETSSEGMETHVHYSTGILSGGNERSLNGELVAIDIEDVEVDEEGEGWSIIGVHFRVDC